MARGLQRDAFTRNCLQQAVMCPGVLVAIRSFGSLPYGAFDRRLNQLTNELRSAVRAGEVAMVAAHGTQGVLEAQLRGAARAADLQRQAAAELEGRIAGLEAQLAEGKVRTRRSVCVCVCLFVFLRWCNAVLPSCSRRIAQCHDSLIKPAAMLAGSDLFM